MRFEFIFFFLLRLVLLLFIFGFIWSLLLLFLSAPIMLSAATAAVADAHEYDKAKWIFKLHRSHLYCLGTTNNIYSEHVIEQHIRISISMAWKTYFCRWSLCRVWSARRLPISDAVTVEYTHTHSQGWFALATPSFHDDYILTIFGVSNKHVYDAESKTKSENTQTESTTKNDEEERMNERIFHVNAVLYWIE